MTTYTKTQLIDMAVDKLGENPDWGVYGFTLIAVSTLDNVHYGYGEFCLSDPEYINDYWQLVCTRQEFEQRVVERKMEKLDWIKVGKYVRVPDGSVKEILSVSEDRGIRLEDYNYYDKSELHPASKPVDNGTPKPTSEWWDYEKNVMLCNPPVGTYCEFAWGNHTQWFECVVLPNNWITYSFYGAWIMSTINTLGEYNFRPLDYKPALTERQQAGLKLWRAINWDGHEIDEEIINGYAKRFEDYCRPYDLGMLK